MNKLFTFTALALLSGAASAGTATATSGSVDSILAWNDNAYGSGSIVYGGVSAVPAKGLLGGAPLLDWQLADNSTVFNPAANADDTWSANFTFDSASGNITGGTLTSSGSFFTETQVPTATNSWWLHEYDSITIDFGAVTAVGTYTCSSTVIAPGGGPCRGGTTDLTILLLGGAGDAGVIGGPSLSQFNFNSATGEVKIFSNNYDALAGGGTDYYTTVSIAGGTVVPVPAAVWLFGSALGLLGWSRRKA